MVFHHSSSNPNSSTNTHIHMHTPPQTHILTGTHPQTHIITHTLSHKHTHTHTISHVLFTCQVLQNTLKLIPWNWGYSSVVQRLLKICKILNSIHKYGQRVRQRVARKTIYKETSLSSALLLPGGGPARGARAPARPGAGRGPGPRATGKERQDPFCIF